jgi:hypothetical protein
MKNGEVLKSRAWGICLSGSGAWDLPPSGKGGLRNISPLRQPKRRKDLHNVYIKRATSKLISKVSIGPALGSLLEHFQSPIMLSISLFALQANMSFVWPGKFSSSPEPYKVLLLATIDFVSCMTARSLHFDFDKC